MFNATGGEISVTPPETLVKYDAPLFAGIETSGDKAHVKPPNQESNSKLEDMVNSMLPPRFVNTQKMSTYSFNFNLLYHYFTFPYTFFPSNKLENGWKILELGYSMLARSLLLEWMLLRFRNS